MHLILRWLVMVLPTLTIGIAISTQDSLFVPDHEVFNDSDHVYPSTLGSAKVQVKNSLPIWAAVEVSHWRQSSEKNKDTTKWFLDSGSSSSSGGAVSFEQTRADWDRWRVTVNYRYPPWKISSWVLSSSCVQFWMMDVDKVATITVHDDVFDFTMGDPNHGCGGFRFIQPSTDFPARGSGVFINSTVFVKVVNNMGENSQITIETRSTNPSSAQPFIQTQNAVLETGKSGTPLPFFFEKAVWKTYSEQWTFTATLHGSQKKTTKPKPCKLLWDNGGHVLNLNVAASGWQLSDPKYSKLACSGTWDGTTTYLPEVEGGPHQDV